MSVHRYYRLAVWLPLVIPALVWGVTRLFGFPLFQPLGALVAALLLSLLYGGAPYALLAAWAGAAVRRSRVAWFAETVIHPARRVVYTDGASLMHYSTVRQAIVAASLGAGATLWSARAEAQAAAQAAASLPGVVPGARVRLWLSEARLQREGPPHRFLLRATVESLDADSLRLRVPGAEGALAVPRSEIRRLEVSRGSPSRVASAVERGLGAALLGAGLAALFNAPADRGALVHERTGWRAAGVGAAWGGAAGALFGVLFPYERWRRVMPRRVVSY
jgi:hypothetical protein